MRFIALLAFCALASCSQDTPLNPEGLFVPNQPIIAEDGWAYDPGDDRYGSAAARKIRFRDAWMSFHNYFTPDDVRARTPEFEAWFAQTDTSKVKNGDEYQFAHNMFT